jgi:pilus assembly protein CpaB
LGVSRTEATRASNAKPHLGDTTTESPPPAAMLAPESMLGRPTMVMPLGSAIAAPETRIQPIPAPLALALDEETAVAVPRASRAEPPGPLDAALFKGSTPLFAALALVAIASVSYAASLFATERQAKSAWVLTQVVVAAEDLQFGDVINVDAVALRAVPPEYATPSVVKGDAISAVLGQRILANVQTGDPIFYSQFASTQKTSRLSDRVVKRGRGFTVPISTTGAVGRWVHPGDIVDVVLGITGSDDKSKQEARAVTLLQKVRILATGQADSTLAEKALDDRERLFSNLTLLLTPEEAEVVALASSLGKLTLTLRNDDDDEVDLGRGFTNIQTLLDGKRAIALQQRRNIVVQSIRALPEKGKDKKRR